MTATTRPASTAAKTKPNLLGRYGPIGIAAVLAAALMVSPAAAAWPLIGGVHATPASDAAVRLAPPTVEVRSALSGASAFVGLAPQPEPPAALRPGAPLDPFALLGLDPQPPMARVRALDPADLVGLDPQPEPPSVLWNELWRNPFALLGLDPRPEPPSRPDVRMDVFIGR